MVSSLDSGSSRVWAQTLYMIHVAALCSWTRHFTLVVPLPTQVNKWVLAGEVNTGG